MFFLRYARILTLVFLVMLAGCSQPTFTHEELKYINEHTVIWVAEDNYYPFIFIGTTGHPQGMSVDYIDLISKKTGLKFQMIAHGQLTKGLELIKNGSVEMISSVRPTPERSEYASFTRPYILINTVMMKRIANPKTVGIGKGYAVKNYLLAQRPDLKIVEFEDDEDSLKALISGNIDSIVMDEVSAISLRKKYRVMYDTSLLSYEYPLSFALSIKDDNEILRSILDKAITGITDDEHERIRQKWM